MRKPLFGLLAVGALLAAGPAAAEEPAKDQPRQLAQEKDEQPTATLASAEVRLPSKQQPEDASEEPAKRPRAKRVTSCRCGGESAPQ